MGVKLYTRRDLAKLLSIGIAGTALESSGAITRSALALKGAMMAIAKGEVMETVTCNVNCATSGDVYSWCVSLGFTTQNIVLVRKSPIDIAKEGRFTPYCILCPISAATNCFRFNGPNNLVLGTIGNGRTESMTIAQGAEYYVFRASY